MDKQPEQGIARKMLMQMPLYARTNATICSDNESYLTTNNTLVDSEEERLRRLNNRTKVYFDSTRIEHQVIQHHSIQSTFVATMFVLAILWCLVIYVVHLVLT
ncbi:uncharacterized protein [Rutidosis leptorrhynchoides]|uniref:uncharacterized protein isoform X1 n=1 Tax=Rutidosis leptorrhynchoides TaxID=125765 RepID=UPI003A99E847